MCAKSLFLLMISTFVLNALSQTCKPPEWTCSPDSYNSGDKCDCNCGLYDPGIEFNSKCLQKTAMLKVYLSLVAMQVFLNDISLISKVNFANTTQPVLIAQTLYL